jgi:hypothetical protein
MTEINCSGSYVGVSTAVSTSTEQIHCVPLGSSIPLCISYCYSSKSVISVRI